MTCCQHARRWHLSCSSILPRLCRCDSSLLPCGPQPLSDRKLPLLPQQLLLLVLGQYSRAHLPCLCPWAHCQRSVGTVLAGWLSHRGQQNTLLSYS